MKATRERELSTEERIDAYFAAKNAKRRNRKDKPLSAPTWNAKDVAAFFNRIIGSSTEKPPTGEHAAGDANNGSKNSLPEKPDEPPGVCELRDLPCTPRIERERLVREHGA